MEKDLIALLEEKVNFLIDKIDQLGQENTELSRRLDSVSQELDGARKRIQELETQKGMARDKIKAILERIDLLGSDTEKKGLSDPESDSGQGLEVVALEPRPDKAPF